jgi:hypothetical protein
MFCPVDACAGAAQRLKLQATSCGTRGVTGSRFSSGQAVPHAPQPAGQGLAGAQQSVAPGKSASQCGLGPHVKGPSCRNAGACWAPLICRNMSCAGLCASLNNLVVLLNYWHMRFVELCAGLKHVNGCGCALALYGETLTLYAHVLPFLCTADWPDVTHAW